MWYDELTDKTLSRFIRMDRVKWRAESINSYERTYRACEFEKSSGFCERMLREDGFKDVERYALPMDGVTAHMDCVMPQAWDIEPGSFLKVEDVDVAPEFRVLADYAQDHFSCGIWSAPTSPEGIHAELIDARNMSEGVDPRGKFVLITEDHRENYRECALRGAAGVLMYDGSKEAYHDFPDCRRWGNGIGLTGWYHVKGDPRVVVYHVTPRQADYLHERLKQSSLHVHAVMNARIFDGSIWTVTGRIPGQSPKEIALIAHIYEPFLSDDAIGAASCAEICAMIRRMADEGMVPKPKYTLRVVISMELFGFSEYFARPEVQERTLYAVSLDGIGTFNTWHEDEKKSVNLRLTAGATPFFTDYLYRSYFQRNPNLLLPETRGNLSDDTFVSDPLIGIPCNWLRTSILPYHHNTGPMFAKADYDLARDIIMGYGKVLSAVDSGDSQVFRALLPELKRQAAAEYVRVLNDTRRQVEARKMEPERANNKIAYWHDLIMRTLLTVDRIAPDAIGINEARQVLGEAPHFGDTSAPVLLSVSEQRASRLVVKRLSPGMPHSLAKVPFEKRRDCPLPEVTISFFDGKRTLLEALRATEYDQNLEPSTAEEIADYIDYLELLEEYGYVKLTWRE